MKFWVYSIDWRTRAVAVLAEVGSEADGQKHIANRLQAMGESDPEQLAGFVRFSTMALTVVSPEMEMAAIPFRHKGVPEIQ